MRWESEFEHNNGCKPVRLNGDNLYPYNLYKFQVLFGVDNAKRDEDEQIRHFGKIHTMFQTNSIGEWIVDKENDGTAEYQIGRASCRERV